MIQGKKISVIIPCRNEAKIIGSVIKKIPTYVDEIIVVDNRSKDNTAEVAKKAGAIVIKENRAIKGIGYGFAHQIGIKKAKGDILVAMDGDDTYPKKQIRPVVEYLLKNNLDVVSCNRLPLKNKRAISPIRQLGINILNLEIALLFGYPIKDALTGMWAIRKETANKLNLKEGGWDLSPEIKIKAIANPEINFGEYRVAHFIRNGEISKQVIWKTGLGHFCYILKERFTTYNPLFRLIYSFRDVLSFRKNAYCVE